MTCYKFLNLRFGKSSHFLFFILVILSVQDLKKLVNGNLFGKPDYYYF